MLNVDEKIIFDSKNSSTDNQVVVIIEEMRVEL